MLCAVICVYGHVVMAEVGGPDGRTARAHTELYAHVDFFKNNFSFKATNQGLDQRTGEPIRKWVDAMANHGSIVRKWANRIGLETVESFIDACLSLENLIDPQKPFLPRDFSPKTSEEEEEPETPEVPLLRVDREYMESFINPTEYLEEQKKKIEDARGPGLERLEKQINDTKQNQQKKDWM